MKKLIEELKLEGKIIVREEALYRKIANQLIEEGISYNAFDISSTIGCERILIELKVEDEL